MSERNSFFDDDDQSVQFEFVKPDTCHVRHISCPPLIKTILVDDASELSSSQPTWFALHNRLLVSYESETSHLPMRVLDLAHSRMEKLTLTEDGPSSFNVVRNGATYTFYSNDKKAIENWSIALRRVCVLTNFHDEYKAIKMIGKGSFAKVYLVESKLNKKNYAVKAFTKEGVVISNKSNAKPAMLNEIDIMRALDHENVIKLYEVFETEKSIYLVLELIQGKSLQEMLKKGAFKEEGSEIKIINTIRSILDALAYLSSKGVMHRDLKPDNILLDKGEKVKIVDFGLASFIDVPEYIFKKCGTPGYIAPEVFKYDAKNSATFYDGHCDVFSIGCILYYMFFGKPFFEGSNASEILKNNRKFTVEFEVMNIIKKEIKDPAGKISKDGLNLLTQLIEFDQHKRRAAADALNHPYFTPVPTGMQKIPGFHEYVDNNSANTSYSPAIISPLKLRTSHAGSPSNFSPISVDKHKYIEKDSLHLDVGRPEITGRVDTLAGNTMNSLLFANRIAELAHSANGSNGSLSPFTAVSRGSDGKRPSSKTFKGHNLIGNSPSFMASMYRKTEEEHKDHGVSPIMKLEQIRAEKHYRNSEYGISTTTQGSFTKKGSITPGHYKNDIISTTEPGMSPFQLKSEQTQMQPNSASPMKTAQGARRYQPFAQKNMG